MEKISVQALIQGYKHFFDAVAYIDVQTRHAQVLFFQKFGKSNPLNEECSFDDISRILLPHIESEFRDEYLRFKDLSTLEKRIEENHDLSFDYKFEKYGWMRLSFVPIDYDIHGKLSHILMTGKSIAYLKELQNQAETDPLTGLLNHKTAKERIQQAMQSQQEGLFLLFDCDHLKAINDYCGHYQGSQCILGIGKLIAQVFTNAISFRYGGDEFGVYLQTKTDIENINERIQTFFTGIDAFSQSVCELRPFNLQVHISIGAVHYNAANYKTYKELFLKADECLYISKKREGNTISFA